MKSLSKVHNDFKTYQKMDHNGFVLSMMLNKIPTASE